MNAEMLHEAILHAKFYKPTPFPEIKRNDLGLD